jgi:hypothetical protein
VTTVVRQYRGQSSPDQPASNYPVFAGVQLAHAIRYALTRWAGLSLFLDDGRVALDSNTVERSIRPWALDRKNASSQVPTMVVTTGR